MSTKNNIFDFNNILFGTYVWIPDPRTCKHVFLTFIHVISPGHLNIEWPVPTTFIHMIFGQASNHFESTQKVHKKSPRVPSAFDLCIKLEHQRGIRRDRGQFVKNLFQRKGEILLLGEFWGFCLPIRNCSMKPSQVLWF